MTRSSPIAAPRVQNIPAGAPFLQNFVAALLDGRVIPGLDRHSGPLALAETKIFVPTQRAGRALAAELARQSFGATLLLPKILPLGALDGAEEDFFGDGLDPALPRAARDIERRMKLGELILAWAKHLKNAIISIDEAGAIHHAPETLLVASSPADAWTLSGELAALIDEMIVEQADWTKLSEVNGEFDDYWRITQNFLTIAFEAWPAICAEAGFVDAAARRQIFVAQEIARTARCATPLIAIGSTGSHPLTAQLLAAIARAPQGAVVLPGLDQQADSAHFHAVLHENPCATHPQHFLARLLKILGVEREAVVSLAEPTPALRVREKFLSEAFRPAETTDCWPQWRAAQTEHTLAEALKKISLIEAADEREEALAIAVALRESLETPDKTAALITPDRTLAERVRAELLRWDVEIDDSGGVSLGATRAGALSRLILQAFCGGRAEAAALIAHPDARFASSEQAHALAQKFELGVLRAPVGGVDWSEKFFDLVAPAQIFAQEREAHPRQREIFSDTWLKLADFAQQLDAALEPLRALRGAEHELSHWLAAHRSALGMVLCGDPKMAPGGEDGEALDALFSELAQSAGPGFCFDAESYRWFFDAVCAEQILRSAARAHPRLKILGLLEARLIGVDRAILAGLDETIWPPQASTDAFLNRALRAELKLSSPERRIGQTAHDFAQNFCAPEVLLSRARKRGGKPTAPSRFLLRLEALAGAKNFKDLRQRGEFYLSCAKASDTTTPQPPLRRPAPCPPLDLRPMSLSVTRIETLRRDPYALYAEKILKLAPLPAIDPDRDAALIGTALHEALEAFCKQFDRNFLPPDARGKLLALAAEKLQNFSQKPEFNAFRWPRLIQGLDNFLRFESARRPLIDRLELEISGKLEITLKDQTSFTLTAKADRLEILRDGRAALVDYKTGTPPTPKQVRAGFAPQLTLEAAMLTRNGFEQCAGRPVEDAFYVALGGGSAKAWTGLSSKDENFADLAERHFSELIGLLNDFRDPAQTFPARPFPQFAAKYNAYDHLARTREWSASGAEEGADE